MNITIDPGHSGPVEPGACAAGLTEAAIVLDISRTLAALLEAAGHSVAMTRTNDISTDDLGFRAAVANEQPADLFLSIHCNAASNQAATGTEVYFYPGSSQGAALADCIRRRIVAATGLVDRGSKEASFQVLRETACPAALVETAFLTCESDRQLLATGQGRVKFSIAIYQGLEDFLN